MSDATWNLIAAVSCTIAGVLTTIAALLLDLSLASVIGIGAGMFATIGGLAWTIALVKVMRRE